MTDLIAVYTTVASSDDAQRIADAALQEGLAACVQAGMVESRYHWKGERVHETELTLMFKTTSAHWEPLAALIRRLHPYELPALYALPVALAEPAYARWVAEQVKPPAAAAAGEGP